MHRGAVLALIVASLGGACAAPPPPPEPTVDMAAEEQAIREADANWYKAYHAHDAAGEAAVFAEDGVAYRPDVKPIVGPAAIQAFEEAFFAENPNASNEWTTDGIHIVKSGDLAIQTGQFHVKGVGVNGDEEDDGYFVTVWKKVDGAWRVAHDIGSSAPPEAPAASQP